jgi:hypothetical protein
MATRKENCYQRNQLNLSLWIREKLPDSSTGFQVNSPGLMLFSKNQLACAFVTVKLQNMELTRSQTGMNTLLCRLLLDGSRKNGIIFRGQYIITFEEDSFADNGHAFLTWEGKKYYLLEKDIIDVLSLKNNYSHDKLQKLAKKMPKNKVIHTQAELFLETKSC